MSILTYILISLALSGVGYLAYLLFRLLEAGFQLRRIMLWSIVLLSFGLPLFHSSFQLKMTPVHPHVASVTIPNATTVQEFCSCNNPAPHDVIMFRASQVYDVVLGSRSWLELIMIGGAIFFLIYVGHTLIKMTRMVRMARKMAELAETDGKSYWLVRGWTKGQAASIRWFGKYIFWNDQLDTLSESDQLSVLRHEWSHIAQANTFEKTILALVRIFWFMNPVYYLISRELETIAEYIADHHAADKSGNRKAYAALLLKVQTGICVSPLQSLGGHPLKKRIQVLLKNPRPRTRKVPAILIGAALVLSGDLFADSIIRQEIQDFAVYEYLNQTNQTTGKTEFCKKCTYETVKQQACY